MKKDDVKKIVLEQMLGNKRGVNVFISPAKLSSNDLRGATVIKNWTGEIPAPNDPEDLWFAFVDPTPNANWEHPVDYIFINDKTGKTAVRHGTSPPDNLANLEKIQ